jgi:hypothetical protein
LNSTFSFATQAAHFAAADLIDRFVEMLDDVEPVEQDLGLGRTLLDQAGVGRPHIHAHDAQSVATPRTHFFGKERLHRFLGPAVAYP